MKTIVITGSTKGIGFALAREFLKRDCRVVISGRTRAAVEASLKQLRQDFPAQQVAGFPCDVSIYEQVQALWKFAVSEYQKVDIWINNAGISNRQASVWELEAEEIKAVVETNILGELYGSKVAMQGFLEQGGGALYNVEGLGSGGGKSRVKGLSIYAMSKAGLYHFNRTLAEEVENPAILVGALQPGMVLTDMVKGQYRDKPQEWEKVKGILGVIASPIEEASSWLVEKMLANRKNGMRFAYGGMLRITKRMLMSRFKNTPA